MSEAMVMCASTPDKVEILSPPEDSKPGDPILVSGYDRRPDAQLNPKKKIFEAVAPDLKVNTDQIATYKGIPWLVNGQPCKSQTLVDVQIKWFIFFFKKIIKFSINFDIMYHFLAINFAVARNFSIKRDNLNFDLGNSTTVYLEGG